MPYQLYNEQLQHFGYPPLTKQMHFDKMILSAELGGNYGHQMENSQPENITSYDISNKNLNNDRPLQIFDHIS